MMANLVFGGLVAFTLFVTAHTCHSGRMFVGSIDESYLDLVQANGVYLQLEYINDGRHVFQHEQHDFYLIYVLDTATGNESVSNGFWVIGPYTSRHNMGMRVRSDAQRPEQITERWEVGTGKGSWTHVRRFKTVCVKHTFVACSSGTIVIRLLDKRERYDKFLSYMGSYELMNVTYQFRPVYRHNDRNSTFLYYLNGMWLISSEVGVGSGYMFVVDNAFRPEFIVHTWIAPHQFQFTEVRGVHILCEGRRSPANQRTCRQENSCSGHGRCIQTACSASGRCLASATFYLCECKPGFFGHDCEKELSCGSLPAVGNGTVEPSMGESMFDLAFYSCKRGYLPTGYLASVCQPNGRWSELRKCIPNYVNVMPIAP